jgi:hypothetical protein
MLIEKKYLDLQLSGLIRTVLEQPAIWAVPMSLGIMWVVSNLTSKHVPHDVHLKMLRLHAPEEMGVSRDYIEH